MPGPPTYVVDMQDSKRLRIRLCCLPSKRRRCSCVAWGWGIYDIVESESDPLTRRAVDLFEKEPLKGKWEVNLHTPTKFGEDPSKDLGGNREQTNKRCSNYSMMMMIVNSSKYLNWIDNGISAYSHVKIVIASHRVLSSLWCYSLK